MRSVGVNSRLSLKCRRPSGRRSVSINPTSSPSYVCHQLCILVLTLPPQIMVTNVTSLLKTVKAVEDEHTRGTRALESTIEAIAQEIRSFDSTEAPRSQAGPEELMRATRPITLATAKAVAAGKSCKQDDVIVAANMGRKAISDMLVTCKVGSRWQY